MLNAIRVFTVLFALLVTSSLIYQNCSDVRFRTDAGSNPKPYGCDSLDFSIETVSDAKVNKEHPFSINSVGGSLPTDLVWTWSFPKTPGSNDYATKNGDEVINVFTQNGTYNVSVISGNKYCADVNITAGTSTQPPCTEPFIAGPNVGVVNQQLNYELYVPDCLGVIANVVWNFGDGSAQLSAPVKVADHTYPNVGSYQITAAVSFISKDPIRLVKDVTILTQLPPIDCGYTAWSAWKNVGGCINNEQQQERTRLGNTPPASNGGAACTERLKETQETICTSPKVDCQWSDWSPYKNVGGCSTRGQKQERSRTHTQEASGSGKACEGLATEFKYLKCETCNDISPVSYLYNYSSANKNAAYYSRFEKWKECTCYGPGCSQFKRKFRSCTAHAVGTGIHPDSLFGDGSKDSHGHKWCDGVNHGGSACLTFALKYGGENPPNWGSNGSYTDNSGRCQ